MKKTLFTLAVLLSSALASFAQPASVPDVKSDATDVYQLYVNGGQNGFRFDGWGGATLSEVTIGGKKVEKEEAFQWSGCQFTPVDVYEKQYFHLDVYPMQDMTLGVVMINSKTSGGNEAEKGYQVPSLTANQWNSIDIPVEYYVNKGASMAHLYQVKLIGKVTADATTADASDGFANGDGKGTFYIGNYYFYGKRDLSGESTTLASVSLDASIVASSGKFTINATPYTDAGRELTSDVTYTISDGATLTLDGNKLTVTVTKAGTYTITATSGKNTATATIYAIEPAAAPTDDASNVLAYYSDTYGATAPKISEAGWNWGFSKYSEVSLADNDKAYVVSHAGTFGLNLGAKDITGYTKLHADIYATKATSGYVKWEGGTTGIDDTNTAFSLKKGWNPVDISIANNTGTEATWLQFYIGGSADADKIDFAIDNVYATTGNVEIPFTIGKADANGFTPVRGTIAEENLADIKALNVTALDISKAKLAEGITKIETANPNTIIAVNFTKDPDGKVTSTQADQLTGSKNLVYRDTYIFPLAKLEFVDGYDVYNKFFISTGPTGYKYTRTIGAKKYVTIMVPAIVEYITLQTKYPALSVYDFDADNSTATEVKFNKGTVLTPAEPHLLHNSSNADITLTVEGTGDLNLAQPASATKGTTVKFIGTYAAATADGSQYGLQGSTGAAPEFRQIVSPAVIPAFRAYLTGVSASAKVFFEGETTGINSIKANGESNDGQVYNLAGQRVNAANLPAGIYVKNGKKFIKK